jgi:hypothetical protein
MKFKRHKPNYHNWCNPKRQQPVQPVTETLADIGERIGKEIQEAFKGKLDSLPDSQFMLDVMCIADGHRFNPNFDDGETCLTCGRSITDIRAGLSMALATATKHTHRNSDGTYPHTFLVNDSCDTIAS